MMADQDRVLAEKAIVIFNFLADFCNPLSSRHEKHIVEWILEVKTECYAKDKVKSLPFFWSFYDNF